MDTFINQFNIEEFPTLSVERVEDLKAHIKDTKYKTLRVLHNNIRSAGKNLDEFKVMLKQIDVNIDVLVLSETWDIKDIGLLHIEGYKIYYNSSKINQNDGVIVYINESIQHEVEIINAVQIKALVTSILHLGKKVQIISVYRPPSMKIDDFTTALDTLLDNCQQRGKFDVVLLVGDVNIDILARSIDALNYLNILSENNFFSLINSYTRVTKHSKTCIDHIFVKTGMSRDLFSSAILQTTITDHYSIYVEFTCYGNEDHDIVTGKLKKYIDYGKLQSVLVNRGWEHLNSEMDVDRQWQVFVETLQIATENSTKIVKITNKIKKRTPWITNGLIKSIQEKKPAI
ncbi:hypothetical protein WA026_021888 [Henosepilachna vigintioctopunctata]|uniref:Endonuclease/exonuclease/phosphatase domain-containing protein n=1 Tax=Henosepilachna vigintioctopunctata TaxID=420089 RepID=A0AAW1URU7_9CUCU